MAAVSMTISDVAPGEVSVHIVSAPSFPKDRRDLTPAQRIAAGLFDAHLAALAAAAPYPKVRVRVNDHPELKPGDIA